MTRDTNCDGSKKNKVTTQEETWVGMTKKGQSDNNGGDTDGDDSRRDRMLTDEETQIVMTVEETEC